MMRRRRRRGGGVWGGGFPLPSRLGDLGERRELPQRGPGRSPGRKRIWCIVWLLERHSWYLCQMCLSCSQITATFYFDCHTATATIFLY